jgi:hypothetical protein
LLLLVVAVVVGAAAVVVAVLSQVLDLFQLQIQHTLSQLVLVEREEHHHTLVVEMEQIVQSQE